MKLRLLVEMGESWADVSRVMSFNNFLVSPGGQGRIETLQTEEDKEDSVGSLVYLETKNDESLRDNPLMLAEMLSDQEEAQ